jgi:hypothetical protein
MTALTVDGLIVVSTLPRPMCDWLSVLLRGQKLYVKREAKDGRLINFDELDFMLKTAEVHPLARLTSY